MCGGEKVLEALCEMFPAADIFTHVYLPSAVSDTIRRHRVRTTFIQKLPFAVSRYESYLPLMPLALEQIDLRPYDLLISSESGPSKGILVSPDTLHICYCHSPMRYVWDMYHDYLNGSRGLKRLLMQPIVHYLRLWDFAAAARVDYFVANSQHVANRIKKHYRRDAEVIHPPVDTSSFSPSRTQDDFYLMVGRLALYKRADLAVEAFNRLGNKLVIIGAGAQLPLLKKMAKPNVSVLGYQPFSVIRDHYARCKALIFPGEEDFGIVPVEAMASGRPVIAFRKGGALETVLDGVTGLFFDEQTPESLIDAVKRFEHTETDFSSEAIVQHARQFDRQRFKEQFEILVKRLM
jgi:glycosyltransferase involved in cell wall biosynthesis